MLQSGGLWRSLIFLRAVKPRVYCLLPGEVALSCIKFFCFIFTRFFFDTFWSRLLHGINHPHPRRNGREQYDVYYRTKYRFYCFTRYSKQRVCTEKQPPRKQTRIMAMPTAQDSGTKKNPRCCQAVSNLLANGNVSVRGSTRQSSSDRGKITCMFGMRSVSNVSRIHQLPLK